MLLFLYVCLTASLDNESMHSTSSIESTVMMPLERGDSWKLAFIFPALTLLVCAIVLVRAQLKQTQERVIENLPKLYMLGEDSFDSSSEGEGYYGTLSDCESLPEGEYGSLKDAMEL